MSVIHNITARLSGICAALVFVLLGFTACTDSETTDSTKFAIFYAGVTDIGPSMNFTLSAPTYIGSAPTGFTITRVTLNGETYDTDCFSIGNETTGTIKIADTDDLPVGTYSISIGCYSNGEYYEFPDAITVNMLPAVPEGITVTPEAVTVDLSDMYNESASAQVVTDEDSHVSITKYEIVQEEGKEYFAISKTGKITVNSDYNGEVLPGKYSLSLKLTTGAGTGIYADAVTFNVVSSPLSLLYTPNSVKVEENVAYTSLEPTLKGSTDGLTYAIKSVTPATDAVTIDSSTGVLSLKENNGLAIGSAYNVSVTATNDYGTKTFEDVFVFNIVDFINPITVLTYKDQEKMQGMAFEYTPAKMDGDELTFSLENVDAALDGQLSIDVTTGAVSAKKGNTIPVGTYTVTVKATNTKSEQTATFALTIIENPYRFTYVHWGNNLGLTPARNYASQYRFGSKSESNGFTIPVAESDIPDGVTARYSIQKVDKMSCNATIDKSTGKITIGETWANGRVYVILVTVTTGKGKEGETSIVFPVFVHCSEAVSGVTIEYTPFAFQVNPRKGGQSVAPVITGVEPSMFFMDYRRTFNYANLNGPEEHVSGSPVSKAADITAETTNFMTRLWQNYATATKKGYNGGAKDPVSYYKNSSELSKALGYVDATSNWSVVVNPNKWSDDYGYANGVFIAQMTFITDGTYTESKINGGSQIFPLAIWFDENF